jgi:nicotinamidase-related amidase
VGVTTALAIVDMQNDFVMPGTPFGFPNARKVIPAVQSALAFFREMALPVFFIIRHHRPDGSDIEFTRRAAFLAGPKYALPGTKGAEVIAALAPLPGEAVIVKPRFSAFMATEFDFMLRRLGVTRLVLCGTQYPNCIRATAFDSIALGYETTVLTDATAAATDEVALNNIKDMQNIGVECVPVEDFIKKARSE